MEVEETTTSVHNERERALTGSACSSESVARKRTAAELLPSPSPSPVFLAPKKMRALLPQGQEDMGGDSSSVAGGLTKQAQQEDTNATEEGDGEIQSKESEGEDPVVGRLKERTQKDVAATEEELGRKDASHQRIMHSKDIISRKRSGSSNQTKPVALRHRPLASTVSTLMPAPRVAVVACQTVGTGIASLDIPRDWQEDRQSHSRKNEAMEKAATAAIRDALAKASLHLHLHGCCAAAGTLQQQQDESHPCWNTGRTIAIQLGVPDLGIGGTSIDVSAACTPMWKPDQVSITSGIGGMYIAPLAPSEEPTTAASSHEGHIVVVASVTMSEERQSESVCAKAKAAASSLQMLSEAATSPTHDLPSRIELQRRLHQAESIIENLLTAEAQGRQRSHHHQEKGVPPVSSTMPPAERRQSQVTPTEADMDPDIEVRTYSSKVLPLQVPNPWNDRLPSQLARVTEGTDEEVPGSQSSSGRMSAASSTSSSTGSFAVAAPSASSYPHTAVVADGSAASSRITLDQLVQIMDTEKQKNVNHNYHDYVSLSDAFLREQKGTFEKNQTDLMLMSKRNVCFPVKIMILIEDCHRRGKTDIASWSESGRAFCVHDHVRFESEILPLYLESSKYSSFLRQLNLYSFRRFSGGVDKGCYYHPKFLRGLPWIASTIQRTKVNGRKARRAGNPDTEPRLNDYSHLGPPPEGSPYWKLHAALAKGVPVDGEVPVASKKK